ncbi:MAG: diguanylate cyclase [Lachnospiraceae bacterium]|nr:diguanylate cyclase [Lachnospiraceae bacterium]
MRNWIVVVDDETLSLTSARTMLASEDMKVSCLRSGRELLMYMEKNNPDLVLLDVMMPEMDGFETFEALRRREKELDKPETPVIFLTGDSDDATERHGLKLGAADYIHKPFNKDILISRIKNTIKNSRKIESLTEDATKDGLTGLFNKAEGISRVKTAMSNLSGGLLILDLDNFKLVNDLFGHEKGDQILKAFADVARNNTREGDILCRIGGDEFLFFCSGMSGDIALSALTSRLNKQLEEETKRILGPEHGIPFGISVGAVMVPEYGREYDPCFKMADEAMYKTKQNGKHGCTVYTGAESSGGTASDPEEELARITKIITERNQIDEALVLGTEAFSAVFRFIERYNGKFGGKILTLLFILKEKNSEDEARMKETAKAFGEMLIRKLDKCDIVMHNRANGFCVLIPVTQEPDAAGIIDRIMSGWEDVPGHVDFEVKTAYQIR